MLYLFIMLKILKILKIFISFALGLQIQTFVISADSPSLQYSLL